MSKLLIGRKCPPSLSKALHNGQCVNDQIEIVRPLQCTASCSVSLCSLGTGGLCVVKTYQKHRLSTAELSQVTRELQLHQQLATEHVVPFWAAVDERDQLHIIMDYASEGDLRSVVRQGPVSETHLRDQVVVPLLHALVELHSRGYVHRDVKPDNVFLSGSGAMLGDFSLAVGPLHGGSSSCCSQPPSPAHTPCNCRSSTSRTSNDSSRSLTASCSGSTADLDTLASVDSDDTDLMSVLSVGSRRCSRSISGPDCQAGGTPAYTAPEVVTAAFNNLPMCEALGPQNDVWSLGMLAAECLMGQHPFGDTAAASGAVLHCVISNQPLPISHLPVSPQCKDWLTAALAKDPRKRWSAERLLKHAWLAGPSPSAQQPCEEFDTAAAAAAAGQEPMLRADTWGHGGRDVHNKQQQCGAGQTRGWQQAGATAVPLWVDDDWVAGLNSALQKAAITQEAGHCRQQERQQHMQVAPAPCMQHYSLPGITSWED